MNIHFLQTIPHFPSFIFNFVPTYCSNSRFLFDLDLDLWRLRILRVDSWIQVVASNINNHRGGGFESFNGVIEPGLLRGIVVKPGERSFVLEQSSFVFLGEEDGSFKDRYVRGRCHADGAVHLVVVGGRR